MNQVEVSFKKVRDYALKKGGDEASYHLGVVEKYISDLHDAQNRLIAENKKLEEELITKTAK